MSNIEHVDKRLTSVHLIPILGVDFQQPWKKIVPVINTQLKTCRYEQFESDIPYIVTISNLNKKVKPYTFDPVRVAFNVLGENFSAQEHATAKLGLQTIYWQELEKVLPNDLFYDEWQKFSVVPVF